MTTWSEKETDFLSGWLGWPASPNRMRRLVMTDREDPRAAKKSLRRCNSSALVKPSRKRRSSSSLFACFSSLRAVGLKVVAGVFMAFSRPSVCTGRGSRQARPRFLFCAVSRQPPLSCGAIAVEGWLVAVKGVARHGRLQRLKDGVHASTGGVFGLNEDESTGIAHLLYRSISTRSANRLEKIQISSHNHLNQNSV